MCCLFLFVLQGRRSIDSTVHINHQQIKKLGRILFPKIVDRNIQPAGQDRVIQRLDGRERIRNLSKFSDLFLQRSLRERGGTE